MTREVDFQIVVVGKFVQCWVCRASKTDGNYWSYTTRKFPDGQVWLTPHRFGCVWSDEAGDGQVGAGLGRALYQE